VQALAERRMDVACVQETQWRGSGCRLFGAIGKRYKLFWMGSKAKNDGVKISVAQKWLDGVVSVERHSETVLVLKLVLHDCLLNVLIVYAPHSGKPDEEKERFWNKVFFMWYAYHILIQNELLERVDTFPYLGSQITEDGECVTELHTRLNRRQAIGASLQKIWKSHSIPISTKIQLMKR